MKLSKTYEPNKYESDIYALWEKNNAFSPQQHAKNGTYSIVIPPPNANGDLHLGHGLTLGIEDIAIRFNRMRGKKTLFLPGADHAGFETQVVYERRLAQEGKSRFDFTREELYSQIYDFVAQNRSNFEAQFRRIGASLDWDRYTYTLDNHIVDRANKTFKRLWDDGLVYRGERLVNYCTFHGTSFADIEVEYVDATTPLYYLKYGPFELATTRPETKFGDTAVAVHPDDERYKQYVNTVITVEGLNGPFELRVIADEMVDPNFGTGAVKITPAHDFNDHEAGKRHNLAAVRVINHDGTLNHVAGKYEGMTVKEARKAVAHDLEEKGLLVKVDTNYKNRVGVCYKCGTVIEPMLMEQWFVKMEPLASRAIKALRDNKVTFYPASKKEQLIRYLEGLHDWNISRQIAWGIPIPTFQNVDDSDDWIYDERTDQEIIEVNGKTYHRDSDVFDTWFSSSSWPYATLHYPDSQDFKDFYPLSLMETGADILYPWVSRMLMLGLYVTDEVPFKEVYLHGIILDPKGAKMSKSKGNVVNPIEKIDQFGADAFRMGIMSDESPDSRRPYDESKLVGARNFCNKLWNIARYIEGQLGEELNLSASPEPKTAADHWILERLDRATKQATKLMEQHRYSEAYELLYHLVWDDLADWYIEASKEAQNASVLATALVTVLKLLHPYAPFITETIWQTLQPNADSLLIQSAWPTGLHHDAKQSTAFEKIKTIVTEARQIKTLLHLKGGNLYFTDAPFILENAGIIRKLALLSDVKQVSDGKGLYLTQTTERCWLDVDYATAQEFIGTLQERQTSVDKQIATLEGRLSNEAYVSKAPKELVAQSKEQLAQLQQERTTIAAQVEKFSSL